MPCRRRGYRLTDRPSFRAAASPGFRGRPMNRGWEYSEKNKIILHSDRRNVL